MKRRDFLKAATGAAGVAGASGAASAVGSSSAAASQTANNTTTTSAGNNASAGNNTTSGNATTAAGGGGGGGGTETVELVDYKFQGATDSPLYIQPGTTVKFVWKTDNHNIVVQSQPSGANWSGVEQIHNAGYTYEHTFQTTGTYEFYCQPHRSLGMTGSIVVNQSGQPPGGGGEATLKPEEMGVPFQAHYVGLATLLAVSTTLVYTFFTLKYGESPHASAPNKED